MELTLVRHGESLANTGASTELDTALTPRGELQASATAVRLAEDASASGMFARTLVSPFRRTLMTCEQIHHALAVPCALYYHICEYISLDEPRYGTFTALAPAEVQSRFPWIDVDYQYELSGLKQWWPSRLESRLDVSRRAAAIRRDISKLYTSDERIIIVSHAETIGRLVEAFTMAPPADHAPMTDNCGIWRLLLTNIDSPADVLLANDASHLEGIA